MLTTEAVQSAIPLAQDMVGRGLSLLPVENTPLAALVKESMPIQMQGSVETEYAFSNAAFDVEFMSNAKQPGTDIIPHNMVLDEIVPVVAESVRNSVAHARSVVVPQIEDLVSRVQEVVSQLSPSSLLGVEVVIFNPPKPMTNGVFETSIEKYSDVSYDANLSLTVAMPEIQLDDLRKLVMTNAAGLDKDIEEWLAAQPEGFLHSVWFDFFMLQTVSNLHAYVTQNKAAFGRSGLDIDRLLAIHLIARNLFDNPPEGVNVNLQTFNDITSTIRNVSGARLYMENQDYYDEVGKRKILVRSIIGPKVVVNGEVYRQWIEAGGENEVLFGNSLTRNPVRDVETINLNKEKFLNEWNRHCAIVASTEATRRFVRMQEIFYSAFRAQLAAETDETLNREAILGAFHQELAKISEKDLDCLYSLSLKLVCRARYPQTDAEEILSNINRVAKENPKLDIREAAAVAVIEYIACWIAHQIKVV